MIYSVQLVKRKQTTGGEVLVYVADMKYGSNDEFSICRGFDGINLADPKHKLCVFARVMVSGKMVSVLIDGDEMSIVDWVFVGGWTDDGARVDKGGYSKVPRRMNKVVQELKEYIAAKL